MLPLGLSHLDRLPPDIVRPAYDRQALNAGMVHIGLGNFHRAHQAWYLHQLMQRGLAQDWAIIGAGVRRYDVAMREKLKAQDCLTTLVELDPKGTKIEVIGSMIDYLPIEADNSALISKMADPSIRIVSLTVTEGGYYLDPNSGAFDTNHPEIVHDVEHPDTPCTAFGAMVAALKRRRAAGHSPLTAMSCDNLQGNGEMLRDCVVGLARLTDPDLAAWIDTEGAFPNSMVDCIVPATGPDLIAQVEDLGFSDAAPVSHENFRQWVIEDHFCAGRPAWEAVGATLTNDVLSYEAMKLRILNGGHQLLANVGEILGVETIAGCMADADIAGFHRKVQQDEILPQVAPVPEITPSAYLEMVEARFANPAIHDTTRRVAFDGSSRHAGFLLPTLRDRLTDGGAVEGFALAEAFWARMCAGTREDGSEIAPNDPFWDDLKTLALGTKNKPEVWLTQHAYDGQLAQSDAFKSAFCAWLDKIWADGSRATLAAFLKT